MAKIKHLPQYIVSRIAAGEVIERPVYAVKELIENAIDAGSDTISILLEEAGLNKIVVTDNGEGMSQEDLQEAIKPHTTSKLEDDTFTGIKTLGFRGEALASIAAVSTLTIQSRTVDAPGGYFVTDHNGEIIEQGPIGMPTGTIVTVQNLFGNVPARKKFLKSNRTEFTHVIELVTNYALAYPEIKFSLKHNNRILFELAKNQPLQDRLEKLLGKSLASQLLALKSDPDYLSLTGFIARPQLSARSLNKQFIFINNRVVSDRLISTAAKAAYGNLLEQTQHPIILLFLNIPHEAVDVNIHPRKEQVSFMNHTYVFETVKQIITKTLAENNLTFHNLSFSPFSSRKGTTMTHTAEILRDSVEPWSVKNTAQIISSEITQLHETYLVVQTKLGMMLIDQHAAHERILFEQFKDTFLQKRQKKTSYALKKPIIIDLPFSETQQVMEHLSELEKLGFHIRQKTENTYQIDAVPELLKDRDIRSLILELLEEAHAKGQVNAIDQISNTLLSFLACRSAVMAGEKLTKDEAKKLVEKLEQTPNNATCPHGRPTKIEVSVKDLHRMFKRV
jgi:DNA mismatch repair protein MutL